MAWKIRRTLGLVAVLGALSFLAGCACLENEHMHGPCTLKHAVSKDGQQHVALGIPMDANCEAFKLLENQGYVVGYSQETGTPLWVSYYLFETNDPAPSRPDVDFAIDLRTGIQVTHDDYTNTGYDRGHMAPSAGIGKCYGEVAQLETYFTSNICPQAPGLNQRCWERFEHKVLNDYAQRLGEVWVFTGPIFEGPCRELEADVRVPTAFYKIVVAAMNGEWDCIAIVMDNVRTDSSPIAKFVTSVDQIERRTGLDFLSGLPDRTEAALEARGTASATWTPDFELNPRFSGETRSINDQACD